MIASTAIGKLDTRPSAASQDPALRLAAAVLVQAVADAREGRYSAQLWLVGEDAAIFAQAAGIDERAPLRMGASMLAGISLGGRSGRRQHSHYRRQDDI